MGSKNRNDAFSGEEVELRWRAIIEGKSVGGEKRTLNIPLGGHSAVDIVFTPPKAGKLLLELVSVKGGTEHFKDSRLFVIELRLRTS
jgi:hypothetical protein